MKKNLLFVIESLGLGGAEKSLVTLLNLLDYSRYNVDLLLFAQGGTFQRLLPKEVHLLPVPDFFAYCGVGWSEPGIKLKQPKKLVAQLRYSAGIRIGRRSHIEKAVLLWQSCQSCIAALPQEYDTAIAYAQGLPTFFVADKVRAKRKAAWINATYRPKGRWLEYIRPYYERFDRINAVSDSVYRQAQETFGIAESRMMRMRDILDDAFALKMAELPSKAQEEMQGSGLKILTVGRLAGMKGYDLAIEAARILKECGLEFRWYAVGDGALRSELEAQIRTAGVSDRFVLLGSRENPYPYFRTCDLYVQPSRFEGFGITLAEAKMFDKPIVATNFDAVGAQLVHKKNGLIVDISARALADGILRMTQEPELRERCVAAVRAEKKGNTEEIEKLYQWLEALQK